MLMLHPESSCMYSKYSRFEDVPFIHEIAQCLRICTYEYLVFVCVCVHFLPDSEGVDLNNPS